MIQGIGLLLGFQLAGEAITRLLRLPVPGAIIGLLLLFAWLQSRAFTDLKTIAIVLLLKVTGTSYATYLSGAQFIQFLIGPAVVAIAVPLFRNWPIVKRNMVPILIALPVGCLTAIVAVVLMGRALSLPEIITMSLAPKSATTGAAMAISHSFGGEPAMTATFTVSTSIIAAVMLVSFMRSLRVKDMAAVGFAAGLSGHAVGTARAFQVDPVAGTFAGIALCLNAILTALIMPVLLPILP